jgi:exonuclease SbcC
MRILSLRLCNLNSLTGAWTIDFTAPEYAASGIFAITGPTGAGKSTILDAICLALFARTPRLGHISKGSNEILSRRTGACFAEVEFETRQGQYRCHWGQHRARRSPEGELQTPRHEIVDARSGKVLESRSKEVGRLVEQVTGMDYDRFTRSILLAQGDFAAFLQADADQRAPILEQITGTSIYSRISKAVHERTSEERQKTALLREAMGNVVLLDEKEEQALMAAVGEGMTMVAGLQQRLASLAHALHRLAAIESLRGQIAESDQLLLDLARRRESAGNDLLKAERGQRAQSLLGEYTRLLQGRERIATLKGKGESLRAALEQMLREQRRIAAEHGQACQQLQDTVALQQRENEAIKAVRAFDLRIHEKKQALAQRGGVRQQTEKERGQTGRQRQELARQLAEIAVQEQHLESFLREHGHDRLLIEGLAGFHQQLQQLEARENDLMRLEQGLQEQRAARIAAEQQCCLLDAKERQAAQQLATLRQRQQAVEEERAGLLAGREPSRWRQEAGQAEQRLRHLEKGAELLTRQQALAEELAALDDSLREIRAQEQRQVRELQALEDNRQLRQQLVARCEENQQLHLRIRSYEEERRHLTDGVPCPLCGALHHPWAEEDPPFAAVDEPLTLARADLEKVLTAITQARETITGLVKDIEHTAQAIAKGRIHQEELAAQLAPLQVLFGEEAEVDRLLAQGGEQLAALRARVHGVDQLEGQLHTVRTQLEQAATDHTDLLQQVQSARHAGALLDNERQRLEQQAGEARAWIERCRVDLLRQLQPLGIDACPPGQASHLLLQLEGRQQAWKAHEQRREQLLRHRTQQQTELDKLDLLLTTIDRSLSQQDTELDVLRREEAGLLAERFERYGDRDPNVEEQRLRTLVQQAEVREKAIRASLTAIDKELHGLSEQVRLNAEELQVVLPENREQESRLLALLPAAGFSDMDDLRGALLPPETLAELDKLKQELAMEQTTLIARRAEQAAALAREEQQQGEKNRADLLADQARLNQELETLQQRIGADRERLAVNTRHKQHFAQQQLALAAQNKELERWELLHQLIGSADGKKFRVFAQGLTFEVMISHANRQLRKMNDRYILLRDPQEPLALLVIDNYQAGEIRSTRNLSGGESFLVSLALSLGLSAMASHNVRVDSLFLDEGFGSLDEEALDTALQTLAELRQDGKLIGIISHVPMLKDRIDIRIQVVPGPGGNSRLLGPGCSHSS